MVQGASASVGLNRSALPACRGCGRSGLKIFLSLGSTPLANALLAPERMGMSEPTYPLDLALCPDCTLVQITETVPARELFEHYVYFSSFSETTLDHARTLVQKLVASCRLEHGSLVIEIASNDGYLLQFYRQSRIPVLGIEPARNVAQAAQQKGVPTLCEFFDSSLAAKLGERGQKADVIHAHNVLAHVSDLNDFVEGIRVLLKETGLAIVEVPYVKDLIDRCEFDTIYHEHLCYFSVTALDRLFSTHGLEVAWVERIPVHGGSIRLCVVRATAAGDAARCAPAPDFENVLSPRELIRAEKEWGLDQLSFYRDFERAVQRLRTDLLSLLSELKGQGKRLAAYGASAKGSTLLNCFGIGQNLIDFVVDRSTVKQGCYTPGTQLPICDPDTLIEQMPDYVLLLAWNLADEVLEQQSHYRELGGKFIIPIPEVQVV